MRSAASVLARTLAAVVVCAAALFGFPGVASADSQATAITLPAPTFADGLWTVSGSLLAGTYPVPQVTVSVLVDSAPVTSASTGADGRFTASFTQPAVGSHMVTVEWVGNASYSPANASASFTVSPIKSPTSITLVVEPTTAQPGMTIGVAGTLLSSSGSAVVHAGVSVSSSWGGVTVSAATDDSGNFNTALTLPATDDMPASVTIHTSYSGDSVFEGSVAEVPISMEAAPVVVDPTEGTAPTQLDTPSATPTAQSTPTPTPTPAPKVSLTDNPHVKTALVLSVAVAATAVIVLIGLGVLASQHHRLATDERRGFGSDFGKHEH